LTVVDKSAVDELKIQVKKNATRRLISRFSRFAQTGVYTAVERLWPKPQTSHKPNKMLIYVLKDIAE